MILKKNQDPTKLFDHFTETNIQYRIKMPDQKKLIMLDLERLPEKYVIKFSTLIVNRNVDLEKFEDIVKAIYRANQGKSKEDSDDDDEVNLVTMDKDDEKKKYYKGDPCKHCGQLHPSEKCWSLEVNKGKHPEWYDPARH
jgi:hypothetical protein